LTTEAAAIPSAGTGQRLLRVLKLRDLVLYGVIVIQPVAPMSPFSTIQQQSHGHAVTAILLAMIAMLLTANSYGKMAAVHPSAGSAFTYVGKEIHPGLGYIAALGMVMNYVLNPIICIVWCSRTIAGFLDRGGNPSWLAYAVLAAGFALVFSAINARGIQLSSRVNALLSVAMGLLIGAFFLAAGLHVHAAGAAPAGLFWRPFYDPANWSTPALLEGTSVAVVTFIGFDGISALAEEAEDPRRNIWRATVLTCLAIGILAALEVYVAQLILPFGPGYPEGETAFAEVAARAGGQGLRAAIIGTLLVANVGSGIGAQLGAARLLYGMGRGGALPPALFATVDPRHRIPRNAVLIVGAVALIGAFVLAGPTGYDLGVQLLNFGALLSFTCVNLAVFVHYAARRRLPASLFPLTGAAISALLLFRLGPAAKAAGAVWLAAGIALAAWRSKGFRKRLINLDFPTEA
jgi:amino acid transporter